MGKLATSRCNGIWETAQQIFAHLSFMLRTMLRGSRHLFTDLLRGNWCNGFWPRSSCRSLYIQLALSSAVFNDFVVTGEFFVALAWLFYGLLLFEFYKRTLSRLQRPLALASPAMGHWGTYPSTSNCRIIFSGHVRAAQTLTFDSMWLPTQIKIY